MKTEPTKCPVCKGRLIPWLAHYCWTGVSLEWSWIATSGLPWCDNPAGAEDLGTIDICENCETCVTGRTA